MVIFGGIYEITKELNDLHLFDFRKNKWITIFEEAHSPKRESSPFGNEGSTSPTVGGGSPKKSVGGIGGNSPNTRKNAPNSPLRNGSKMASNKPSNNQKSMKKSVANLGLNTSSTMLQMSRNGKSHHTNTHNILPGVQLTTPTSISMMNSFIIKNADTSFDQYYTSMKKRKQT